MRYTNFILTVIAILRALNLGKPTLPPANAYASSNITDVNIVELAGTGSHPTVQMEFR